MPTINKPFLLRLVLVVFAVAASLGGIHQLQADRKSVV